MNSKTKTKKMCFVILSLVMLILSSSFLLVYNVFAAGESSNLFNVADGTVATEKQITYMGNAIDGVEISAITRAEAVFNNDLYIKENNEDTMLLEVALSGATQLNVSFTDSADSQLGFNVKIIKTQTSMFVSAGVLNSQPEGYCYDSANKIIGVSNNYIKADGTKFDGNGIVKIYYDGATHKIYAELNGVKLLVRALNGFSERFDYGNFSGFRTYTQVAFNASKSAFINGTIYSSESANFLIGTLNNEQLFGLNDDNYKSQNLLITHKKAYTAQDYYLPMPKKISVFKGVESLSGYKAKVMKGAKKVFDGIVTPDSKFKTETGEYDIKYYLNDGVTLFDSYKLRMSSDFTRGELIVAGKIATKATIGSSIAVHKAFVECSSYLNGYVEQAEAKITKDGVIKAKFKKGEAGIFIPLTLGQYTLTYSVLDSFGQSYESEFIFTAENAPIFSYSETINELGYKATEILVAPVTARQNATVLDVSRKIVAPDGVIVSDGNASATVRVTLSQIGIYKIICEAAGFKDEKTVTVFESLDNLFSVDGGASALGQKIVRTPMYNNLKQMDGVGFTTPEKSTITFNKALYVGDNDLTTPLLDFTGLLAFDSNGVPIKENSINEVTITLTDVLDRTNVVTVKFTKSVGNDYLYVRAGASGQTLLGINKNELQVSEGTIIPFTFSDTKKASVTQYAGENTSFKLYYNPKDMGIYVSPYRHSVDDTPYMVRKLDTPNYLNEGGDPVADVPFKGFSNNEIELSMKVESIEANAKDAGILILGVDGQNFATNKSCVISQKSPASGIMQSNNGVVNEPFSLPIPKFYDVMGGKTSGGIYTVTKYGQVIYSGKEATFTPEMLGQYNVEFSGYKDSFNTVGKPIETTIKIFNALAQSLELTNKQLVEGVEAQLIIDKNGNQVGAKGFSNIGPDGRAAVKLEIFLVDNLVDNLVATINNVAENEKYIFANKGKYKLRYSVIDLLGNVIAKEYSVMAIRSVISFIDATQDDKWVVNSKDEPLVIGKANFAIYDSFLGEISPTSAGYAFSAKINLPDATIKTISGAETYSFSSASDIGKYSIVYTVSYLVGADLQTTTKTRNINISNDDVAPVLTLKSGLADKIIYYHGDTDVLFSVQDATAQDNVDTTALTVTVKYKGGKNLTDVSNDGWAEANNKGIKAMATSSGFITIRYQATDAAGNTGYYYRQIEAIDFIPPEIIFKQSDTDFSGSKLIENISENSKLFKAKLGSMITLPQATVTDKGFSEVTLKVSAKLIGNSEEIDVTAQIKNWVFTPSKVGFYVVEYFTIDSAGFITKYVFAFDVRIEWLTAELENENRVTGITGELFNLAKLVIKDYDGNMVGATIYVKAFNGGKEIDVDKYSFLPDGTGTYTIEYFAEFNGEKLSLTNLITFVDGIKPVITLSNDLPKKMGSGEFVLSQATALDETDGSLLVTITVFVDGEILQVVDGKFKVEKGKDYKIVYRAVDFTGNESIMEFNYSTKANVVLIVIISVIAGLIVVAGVVVAVIVLKKKQVRGVK